MAKLPTVDTIAADDVANELVTGEAVALDLRPASFVLRGAGAMIDFIVYIGAYIGFILLIVNFASGLDEAAFSAVATIGFVVAVIVIPTAVELLSQGKSLGKLAIGARIVRDDGGAIGFRHAFIRSLTAVFEIYGTLGGMAAFIALLNSRAKRLGDFVAGTYSQNERVSAAVSPIYGVPLPLLEWSRTADVAKMPDALARRVAQFLSQAGGLIPATRDRLARELANEVSIYVSPLPQTQAELFLAGVAALRREREFAALQLEAAGLERLAPVLDGLPRGFPDRG